MSYQIKPKVLNRTIPPNSRKIAKEEQADRDKTKLAALEKNRKTLSTDITDSIEKSTQGLTTSLEGLKTQVEKISFNVDIPENDDTKIISAINDSTKGVEKALERLNTQVSKIEFKSEKTDMTGVEKSL